MRLVKPTVFVTRPEGAYAGAERLRVKLESLGFRPVFLPISKVEQLSLTAQTKDVVRRVLATDGQWIAFLSPSAVFIFKNVLERVLHSTKIPASILLAAQGKGTAEAIEECFGRKADFLPTVFVAEEFAKQLAQFIDEGAKVFVPQSADGRDVFAPTLRALAVPAETIDTYCIVDEPLSEELKSKVRGLVGIEAYVVFMSPSSVRATARAFKEDRAALESLRIVSVGPVTTEAVQACGLKVFTEATEHSEDGVLEALKKAAG